MLVETVAEARRRFGDRPVLVAEEGWPLTYTELDRLSDETAAGLQSRGVGPGDVVGLVVPASPEHFVAYVAAAKLGAITAAVNPRLAAPERQKVLELAGPTAVLATPELAPESDVPSTGRGAARPVEVRPAGAAEEVLAGVRLAGEAPPRLLPDPTRPVAIVFTSGTTGLPKGAVFGGRQLDFITACDVGPEWGGGGPALAGSALAHLGPMTKFPGTLRRGSTQYLTKAWEAGRALRMAAERRVPALGGVPTQVALMLRHPDFERLDLSALRAIVMGGGPATPALVREARRRFEAAVAVRYSCTEAGIGTGTGFGDPEEDAEVTVGRPQRGVTLSVVDEEGRPMPPGEVGEVCLASPAVMTGYWRDRQATAAAFTAEGAVRTGDQGWIDEQGRLRLAGRGKDRYVRGGNNVYPMEVEGVLAEHEGVASVAVVGRPDPVMGEVGVAVVVPPTGRPAPSLEELRSFAGGRLARYKLPDALLVVDALPLTSMDKVDRRALSGMVERSSSPEGSSPSEA